MPARPDLLLTTRFALRALIVINILGGAAIAALFIVSFAFPAWFLTALDFPAKGASPPMIGVRLIMVIGLIGIPLAYVILTRLRAVVESVRDGDPFIPENARRLHVIALALLAIQLLHLALDAISAAVSMPDLGGKTSVDSWLAVLLLFVLARVFDIGTRMRADLDGTV